MRNFTRISERNQYAAERGFELHPVPGDHYAKWFVKGATSVWRCIHGGSLAWAVAELEPYEFQPSRSAVVIKTTHYVRHEYFESLAEALDEADKRQGESKNESKN